MAIIDIIILVLIGIGTIWGVTKGFLRQLASLIGLIVGLVVARALFAEVGDWGVSTIGVRGTIAQRGLGAIKFMLLIGLVAHLLEYVDAKNELIPQNVLSESVLYKPMYDFVGIFIPAIKGAGEQIMNIEL